MGASPKYGGGTADQSDNGSALTLSEKIRRGMLEARQKGVRLGTPRRDDVDPYQVEQLRDRERLSWNQIASRLGAGRGTVVRAYQIAKHTPPPSQKGAGGVL